MKKTLLFAVIAAMFIFVSSCSKDDETAPDDNPNTGHSFTGINKISITMDGTTQEFVFADENYKNSDTDASLTIGTMNTENDSVYTEVTLAAAGVFDHVTLAAMTVSYFGTGTGSKDISYGLETGSGLNNFMGSSFMLMTDTASMPTLYFLEEATATITKYGDVNGYIEGTFQSTSVSLAGVPQPGMSISGNFKAIRFEDGK